MAEDQYIYRDIFVAAHGEGPHSCYFCQRTVVKFHIHHKDGNHKNHTPGNLVPSHNECHVRHHHRGVRKSVRSDSASGVTGVKPNHRRPGTWMARWICLKCHVRFYVGRGFASIEDATKAQQAFQKAHMREHPDQEDK